MSSVMTTLGGVPQLSVAVSQNTTVFMDITTGKTWYIGTGAEIG
jgi:hypothetical protein